MNIKLTNLLCNSVARFVPYFQPRDHGLLRGTNENYIKINSQCHFNQ